MLWLYLHLCRGITTSESILVVNKCTLNCVLCWFSPTAVELGMLALLLAIESFSIVFIVFNMAFCVEENQDICKLYGTELKIDVRRKISAGH